MTDLVFPWPPAHDPPAPNDYPWDRVPDTSSFLGVPFAWDFGGPKRERRDGPLDHYTGKIYCITSANFDALWVLQRPVSVTAITPVGPVYVDWLGDDPSGDLVMPSVTRRAILVSLAGDRWLPGDIHEATADFLLLN